MTPRLAGITPPTPLKYQSNTPLTLTEPPHPPPSIQTRHVRVHIVDPKRNHHYRRAIIFPPRIPRLDSPIRIRRTLTRVPHARRRELAVQPPFRLGLVVHTIKPDHALEEDVEFRMGGRILGDLKEGSKDVYRNWLSNSNSTRGIRLTLHNVLEVVHLARGLVHFV